MLTPQIAIETIRPEATADVLTRADSPIEDSDLNGTGSFQPSDSSAVSSSFQGTETDSLQDGIASESMLEKPLESRRWSGIEKAIDRLYRLSLMIRQPSRFSQNDRVENFVMTDDEGNKINEQFAAFTDQLVQHRFADAPEFLRCKLSRGIVTRRKRFLWRQSHQRKLSGVGSTPGGAKPRTLAIRGARHPDSTVRAVSVLDESPAEVPDLLEQRHRAHPAPSRTSASAMPNAPLPLATALEDERSVQSTAFTMQSAAIPADIPRPPKPADGCKEFECPYCCLILPIKHAKAHRWR